MPIYEFVCPSCKCKFELLRPLSKAGEPAVCPRCHKDAERQLSTFSCYSTSTTGFTNPVGGSSCSSCGSGNCTSCGG